MYIYVCVCVCVCVCLYIYIYIYIYISTYTKMPKRLNLPAIRRGPVEQWQDNGFPVWTVHRVSPEFVS